VQQLLLRRRTLGLLLLPVALVSQQLLLVVLLLHLMPLLQLRVLPGKLRELRLTLLLLCLTLFLLEL
jgi:hypothetical protein